MSKHPPQAPPASIYAKLTGAGSPITSGFASMQLARNSESHTHQGNVVVKAISGARQKCPNLNHAAKVLLRHPIAARYNRTMTMTILTCVSCGKTLLVRDEPDEKRDRKCTCNQSMIERRRPGSVL